MWLAVNHRVVHMCLFVEISTRYCKREIDYLPSPTWKAYSDPSGCERVLVVSNMAGAIPLGVR